MASVGEDLSMTDLVLRGGRVLDPESGFDGTADVR